MSMVLNSYQEEYENGLVKQSVSLCTMYILMEDDSKSGMTKKVTNQSKLDPHIWNIRFVYQWYRSGNFEQISHAVLVFPLLTLNK